MLKEADKALLPRNITKYDKQNNVRLHLMI